jgi:formate hydrogenlyase transcriptional activator
MNKDRQISFDDMLKLSHETVERSPFAIFWVNQRGEFYRVNEAAAKLCGRTREELQNLTVEDVDESLTNEQFTDIWNSSNQLEQYTFQSRLQQKEGNVIPVEVTMNYLTFNGIEISVSLVDNISKRFEAKEHLLRCEKRLKAVLNNHFQLNGLLNNKGEILMFNEAARRFHSALDKNIIGKPFWELEWWDFSDKSPEFIKNETLNSLQGEFVRFDQVMIDSSGEPRNLDISFSPMFDENGKVQYVIPEARDVTEIKQAEKQLRSALSEVESLKKQLEEENIYLQEEIKLSHNFSNLIGSSKPFKETLLRVEKVAKTSATVLIVGETGTGKELISRAIHDLSDRHKKPLVKVNCAALPASLIESELFGHEKGSFTGAFARKIGRFELAHNGTLFLDEIGELPTDLQIKLLRVLQEGEFERVGGRETLNVDVRVITATNRNLEKQVECGEFRQDLYFRLNVFPIRVPPLRERMDDLPILANHFVKKLNSRLGTNVNSISKQSMDRIMAYQWPGNVRELENIIERTMIGNEGNKLIIDKFFIAENQPDLNEELLSLEENERQYILKVLKMTNWRVSGEKGAAKLLDINPQTLFTRMRKLDIKK